jgi:hypothetical protein
MLCADMNRSQQMIVLVVAVLVGAGVAIAASSSSGSLHACANKRTGALRLLSHGKCKHSERQVSWSVSGPAGKAGPRGVAGSPGPAGVTGPDGTARAYARVIAGTTPGATPTFDTAATKGFTSVAYGKDGQGKGEFCLAAPGINPSDTAPVVSTYYESAFANTQASVFTYASAPDCPSGDFEVVEQVNGTPATGVDFDIVVP